MFITEKQREDISKKHSRKIEGASSESQVIISTEVAKMIQEERRADNASMTIVIKTILTKKNRETNLSITHVKDPMFDCIYGIYAGIDDFKNIKWSRIQMMDIMELNLNNIDDAKKWAVIRMHPKIAGSPLEADPIYEVNDPTIEAQKTSKKVNLIQKLFAFIERMDGLELADTMRYLGLTLSENMNYEVVKAQLLEASMNNPKDIYDKLTLQTRSIESKLRSAISLNIVMDHPEKGILYNEVPLGININDAVNRLAKDKNLYTSILTQVEEKDVIAKNIQNFYLKSKEKKEVASKKDDDNDKIKM